MSASLRVPGGSRFARLCLAAYCAWLLAAAGQVRAESLDGIFKQGNEAYFRGDFARAVRSYEQLLAAGVRDADVYVNLGLARARSGALGAAILAFEQALHVRPGDEDASSALTLARAAVGKRGAEKHGEAVVETRPPLAESLVRAYREDTVAIWALLLDALFFVSLLARRRAQAESVRTGLAIAASVLALGGLIALSALFIKRSGHTEGRAAIVLQEAVLREAPDPRATQRGEGHEGGSARVLGHDGAFFRIRTATGAVGWIAQHEVGLIAD